MKEGRGAQGKGAEETPSPSSDQLTEAGSAEEEAEDAEEERSSRIEAYWRQDLWSMAKERSIPADVKR
eukprot:971650-Heterocapsa_arctica.AAC.1